MTGQPKRAGSPSPVRDVDADALAADDFTYQFGLSVAVVRHLQRDPLLPAELVPQEWPGQDLRSAYRRFDEAFKKRLSRGAALITQQNRFQRIEHRGILDCRRQRLVAAVGDAPHGGAQELARTGLRQRGTTTISLKDATGADVFAHRRDELGDDRPASPSVKAPALSTTRPRGTWPLISSAMPITAHSATAGCRASTASIDPVDIRWPATLITSSVRPMTNR